jgi:hypothetical protein
MRSRLGRGTATLVAAVAALALTLGAAACSGDGDGGGAAPTSTIGAGDPSSDGGGDGGGDGATTEPPSTTSTTDPSEGPAAYTAYRDPAQLAVDPVAVGERFGLLVEAQPALGQRWQIVSPPDPAVLTTLGTELTLANAAVPGSPDTHVFGFVGRGPGTTTVSLLEVKADGFQVEGAEAVTFTITVTPDGLPVVVDDPDDGTDQGTSTAPGSGSGSG